MNTSLTPDREAISRRLEEIPDPLSSKGLISAGRIEGIGVRADGVVAVTIASPAGREALFEPVGAAAQAAIAALPGVKRALVTITAEVAATPGRVRVTKGADAGPTAPRQKAAPAAGPAGITAIIAVASAKGGVGKSTVAVNLAAAFKDLGLRVGLLDCDVYGPSLPTLLGLQNAKPEMLEGGKLAPLEAFGLATMSIGYIVDVDAPMIWRGPMATSAIRQMLDDVAWPALDILVLDMPPGTGDIQLTIAQRLQLAGAIIVSTPQEVALADVRRGLTMFDKTHVPILGVIENMAWLAQADGARLHVFGEGGARRTATAMGAPFLGEVPIDIALRESADAGAPLTATQPDHPISGLFRTIAQKARANMVGAAKPAPIIRFE
jgi:ATP-binding protein involved in chromosome partitioning